MNVIRAREMGFCFGVRDALDMARTTEHPEDTTIFGEIVHNEDVQRALRARGFHELSELERERGATTERVLVTAHGISDAERARLLAKGHRLIDTTCPLVQRAHDAALELAGEGRHVIVLGRKGHVEVRGLTGDLEAFTVVSDECDVATWSHPRLGIVCQTTFPPLEASILIGAIARANPGADIEHRRTICAPTLDRQRALTELLPRVEALVVIGGRNSHNTKQLAATARRSGKPVLQIEGPDELDATFLEGIHTVGLTAGTSTPDATIESVERALRAWGRSGSPSSRASHETPGSRSLPIPKNA